MSTLKERLQELMSEHNLTTQQQLADFAGVSKGLVGQWFKGDTGLGKKPLIAFERKTHFSARWLADGVGEKYKNSSTQDSSTTNNFLSAQNVDNVIQSHQFTQNHSGQGDIVNAKTVHSTPNVVASDNLLTLNMPDNSFDSHIPQGSIITVDTGQKQIIEGKIYLIKQNNIEFVRRLFQEPPYVSLVADNKNFPSRLVDSEHIEIIGRVVQWCVID